MPQDLSTVRPVGNPEPVHAPLGLGIGPLSPSLLADLTDLLSGSGGGTPSNAPAQNWRLGITGPVTDSAGDSATQTAVQNSSTNKRHASVSLAASQTRTITIPVAAVTAPGGLFYACTALQTVVINAPNSTGTTATAQRSTDGGSTWTALSVAQGSSLDRGLAFTIPAGGASLVRITLVNGSSAAIASLGVFQLPASGKADIWLLEGASFEDYGHRPDQWTGVLNTAAPLFDPIVFNQGVAGYTAAQVKAQTVTDLPNFPLASYVYANQGGNTVTNTRPYATASGTEFTNMGSDITAMIQAVKTAGKIPLVQGISYREYAAPNAVANNTHPEYGSLPYNQNIVYPVLSAQCPDQFSSSLGVPLVDSYAFFLTNRAAILGSADVHPQSDTAYGMVRAYEASIMAAYIYGTAYPASLYEQAVAAAEAAKTTASVNKAQELINVLVSSAAKTAFQNRINAIVVSSSSNGIAKLNLYDSRPGGSTPATSTGWNNLDQYTNTSVNLNDTSGAPTGWAAVLSSPGASGTDSGKSTGNNSGAVPDDCLRSYVFCDKANTQGFGASNNVTCRVSGLNNAKTYKIQVVGSRINPGSVPSRLCDYSANGSAVVTSNIIDNTAFSATFNTISPTSGYIDIKVAQNGSENFAYMNALIITEN